jgi:hypothetical protein
MFGQYDVELDNGEHHEVRCDNRDFVAFRRRGFRDLGLASPDPVTRAMADAGDNDAVRGLEMMEFLAWMVWHSGERSGLWSTDYETFTEKECVSFTPLGDGDVPPTEGDSPAP